MTEKSAVCKIFFRQTVQVNNGKTGLAFRNVQTRLTFHNPFKKSFQVPKIYKLNSLMP